MVKRIEVETELEEKIEEVWLGDDGPMTFYIGKVSPIMSLLAKSKTMKKEDFDQQAVIAQSEWLENGFDPDDWQHIQDRLNDPKDPLDYRHITSLFQSLMEEAAERPPTSSSGSSASRRKRTSEARPSRAESTSTDLRQESSAM